MRWHIFCALALMTLACNQVAAGEGRELAFDMPNAPAGGKGEQTPLPCRETAIFHTLRDDPDILSALSHAVIGRASFVAGESEGANVTKYTDRSLARVWKPAAGTRFANCIAQCLALSPPEKPVRLKFTQDGWQSTCEDAGDQTHDTLGFGRRRCGTNAEWREVLVQQDHRASGAWVVCATLATWGDNRNRDYRMKVEHLPPAVPTIAVATE